MHDDEAHRRQAIEEARRAVADQPVYLDTETTGLDADSEIVEICILDHLGRPLVDTLVRPEGRIPPGATRIHGITDAMVRDAPRWPEAWPAALRALAGRRVGIYNADYDVGMIRRVNQRHGLGRANAGAFCIMKLYARYHGEPSDRRAGEYRWQRLEDAGRQCRIVAEGDLHRARADTALARAVLHHMAGTAATATGVTPRAAAGR
jgi:DNA polymerase III epsilon subunit-like protein